MPERYLQNGGGPGIDLSGLANAIWSSLISHITDVGDATWSWVSSHLPEVGQAIWTPLSEWFTGGIHASADAVWSSSFVAISTMLVQMPPTLTYNMAAYRAIATDPIEVALGGGTLAVVLLGLRTMLGAFVGKDHVLTHISGRLLPATAGALAYGFILTWVVDRINVIAQSIAAPVWGGLMSFPLAPNLALVLPFLALWLILIWYGITLLIRVAYGLFRFLVAMVFGPVAIILWAIPQTEWVTSFWIREFVGWGTTPILVAVCLGLAIPLAIGQAGFLGAVLFAIAGFKAARDLVGLFAMSKGGGGGGGFGITPFAAARLAVGAASGGGAAVAASLPANRTTTLADQYGYQ